MSRNESVGVLTPKSYEHNLSHQHATTLDWFRLQPIGCIPMVKTDKFNINISNLLEAAPLSTKVYGAAYLDFHAFFVPKRILWDDWENYRYGNNRSTSTNFSLPSVSMGRLNYQVEGPAIEPENGVWKYIDSGSNAEPRRVFGGLGYPVNAIVNHAGDGSIGVDTSYQNMPISVMQARAYQRIWWDWYRDSVHIEESNKDAYLFTSGGIISENELQTTFQPRYRCWRKDYITTLLESPQLGNASKLDTNYEYGPTIEQSAGYSYPLYLNTNLGKTNTLVGTEASDIGPYRTLNNTISVAAMRAAVAAQRFAEKLNITGTRPIERIQSLFGAKTNPVRLDMSEFIGSHRQRVNISGLTNTGSGHSLVGSNETGTPFGINNSTTSFGQTTGRGYSEGNTPSFNYTAEEDGYFIVIASLMPEFANPSAVNRQFMRGLSTPDASRDDFYTAEFDGLDYQECLYNEVCLPEYTIDTQGLWGIDYDPYKVAGYQPRYEDYRYIQDRVSGDFNEKVSSVSMRQMLFIRNMQDGYQSGQIPTGIQLTTPNVVDRAAFDNHFQVADEELDHFVLNTYFNVKAFRPISKAELPTALSDLANSELTNVANGGVRL